MRLNRKFSPVSLEIETEEELLFLQEIVYAYIKARDSFSILGKINRDGNLEKASYLLKLLERT